MVFNKINIREIILVVIAIVLIILTAFSSMKARTQGVSDNQIPVPALGVPQPEHEVLPVNDLKNEQESMIVDKEMADQMDRDRNQQRQIKMLKMQLEQINLQLDNEKALTEINKLKKENAGYVKGEDSLIGNGFPNLRILYIGGTDGSREAILSIDGTSYSVREKDKPVSNIEILSVTDKGVKVHFTSPQELTTVINYVQD